MALFIDVSRTFKIVSNCKSFRSPSSFPQDDVMRAFRPKKQSGLSVPLHLAPEQIDHRLYQSSNSAQDGWLSRRIALWKASITFSSAVVSRSCNKSFWPYSQCCSCPTRVASEFCTKADWVLILQNVNNDQQLTELTYLFKARLVSRSFEICIQSRNC